MSQAQKIEEMITKANLIIKAVELEDLVRRTNDESTSFYCRGLLVEMRKFFETNVILEEQRGAAPLPRGTKPLTNQIVIASVIPQNAAQ